MRILVVASTLPAGHRLKVALGHEGLMVDTVALDDDPGAVAAQTGPYDAILIEAAGLSHAVIAGIRAVARQRLGVPVVVLVASATPESESEALDAGADDVLMAPMAITTLVVRLRALQRRMLGHLSAWITIGNTTLDQAKLALTVDGRDVRITRREFDVLEMLFLRRGSLVTKADFLQRLYGSDEGPDSRTLDVFICKVRRKLAAAGAAEFIRTAWGRGYMAEEPPLSAIAAARSRFADGHLRRPNRLTSPAKAWAEAA
ncbi:winged helix-turn-helix domain-containing protein [Falsiroseomonas stagni]|uniref:Two-component system, cell cycle response regulator CtrA n=1 Tax=Falsiroseomonas stagni DSM 19981 TaxID=1123062 RepID=A0A1I3X755_9PROT|nr:response regulator transcription factor [Falsiroseomonas stagni]SFK15149.1 two-component system, cell cycle response regulator CtrA [Falsiroseomonas stagni DSM 19981]